MDNGQRAARWLARQSGQIQPGNGKRTLTDGTVITETKFSPPASQAQDILVSLKGGDRRRNEH